MNDKNTLPPKYYVMWPKRKERIKNDPKSEYTEYETDTTKVIGYKLDWVLYITDMIQL